MGETPDADRRWIIEHESNFEVLLERLKTLREMRPELFARTNGPIEHIEYYREWGLGGQDG